MISDYIPPDDKITKDGTFCFISKQVLIIAGFWITSVILSSIKGAVGRPKNTGVPVIIWWALSVPLG